MHAESTPQPASDVAPVANGSRQLTGIKVTEVGCPHGAPILLSDLSWSPQRPSTYILQAVAVHAQIRHSHVYGPDTFLEGL